MAAAVPQRAALGRLTTRGRARVAPAALSRRWIGKWPPEGRPLAGWEAGIRRRAAWRRSSRTPGPRIRVLLDLRVLVQFSVELLQLFLRQLLRNLHLDLLQRRRLDRT